MRAYFPLICSRSRRSWQRRARGKVWSHFGDALSSQVLGAHHKWIQQQRNEAINFMQTKISPLVPFFVHKLYKITKCFQVEHITNRERDFSIPILLSPFSSLFFFYLFVSTTTSSSSFLFFVHFAILARSPSTGLRRRWRHPNILSSGKYNNNLASLFHRNKSLGLLIVFLFLSLRAGRWLQMSAPKRKLITIHEAVLGDREANGVQKHTRPNAPAINSAKWAFGLRKVGLRLARPPSVSWHWYLFALRMWMNQLAHNKMIIDNLHIQTG